MPDIKKVTEGNLEHENRDCMCRGGGITSPKLLLPPSSVSIAQGIITIDTIERKESHNAIEMEVKPLQKNSKANIKLTVFKEQVYRIRL
jgi:hypothetical protein